MKELKLISSDSHVVEPPMVWADRMDPSVWGSRIPHVRTGGVDDPYDSWFVGDQKVAGTGAAAAAGKRFENPEAIIHAGRYSDILPGAYDPIAHLKDMDLDGVTAGMIYPSVALPLFGLEDTQLVRAILEAYNTWLAEFCSVDPQRLKGAAGVVLDDQIPEAIESMQRAVNLGLSAVMISSFPREGERYHLSRYEPFWAAANDLDIPLNFHVTTNRFGGPQIIVDGKPNFNATDRSTTDFYVRQSVGDMVFSGVFERFPNLKMACVEHELGWIPFFTQRMDVQYKDRPDMAAYRFKDGALPSDFMRRNVYHGFQEDALGIQLRDLIGVDQMLWGSDYPHAESTFPYSKTILDRILDGVPTDERAKMVGLNAAQLYKFH